MRAVPAIILAGVAAACSAVSVDSTRDPDADFSGFRTFSFADDEDLLLRATLSRELAARGLRPSREAPDLIVRATVGSGEVMAVSPYAYGPGPSTSPDAGITHRPVRQSYLFLEFVDARSGKSVWRGRASAAVEGGADNRSALGEAIRALMEKYPD